MRESKWKKADGDALPSVDKEVVALVKTVHHHSIVCFAHRVNPNGDAIGYDNGGWNIPNVEWWLDEELPTEINNE